MRKFEINGEIRSLGIRHELEHVWNADLIRYQDGVFYGGTQLRSAL